MMAPAHPVVERAVADRALMDRVLREVGAPRELPGPTMAAYLRDVWERAVTWLSGAVGTAIDRVALERIAVALAAVTLLSALALAAWLVGRRLRRGASPTNEALPPAPGDAHHAPWDAAQWRIELERRLQSGDARGALAALWWWMARALAADQAQPTWTSRELLRHSGRGDLLPQAVAMDRLAYGLRAPEPADVARLYHSLSGVLA